MASESASISIGVVLGNTSRKNGSASAQITTGALESANPYSGGTTVSADASKLRTQLPRANIHFGTVDSQGRVTIDPVWYRFLDFVSNVQLGGPNAPTVADLDASTVSTRTQAIQAQTAVAAVSQQVTANAASLGAVVQVAQNNSLSGASQIPPVVYSSTGRGPQP